MIPPLLLQASLRRRRLVFETQLLHAERLRDLLESALLRATALHLDDLVNQVIKGLLLKFVRPV